jgi:DNA-binding NtrC family response regulator
LRERMGDIPLLSEHLLSRAAHNTLIKGIESEVEGLFLSYHWPGNIREMVNVIERAIPFTDGDQITMASLPAALTGGLKNEMDTASAPLSTANNELAFKDAKEQLIDAFERQYLVDLIDRHNGNVSKAARAAHMDRKSITRLLKKHGIR